MNNETITTTNETAEVAAVKASKPKDNNSNKKAATEKPKSELAVKRDELRAAQKALKELEREYAKLVRAAVSNTNKAEKALAKVEAQVAKAKGAK